MFHGESWKPVYFGSVVKVTLGFPCCNGLLAAQAMILCISPASHPHVCLPLVVYKSHAGFPGTGLCTFMTAGFWFRTVISQLFCDIAYPLSALTVVRVTKREFTP